MSLWVITASDGKGRRHRCLSDGGGLERFRKLSGRPWKGVLANNPQRRCRKTHFSAGCSKTLRCKARKAWGVRRTWFAVRQAHC